MWVDWFVCFLKSCLSASVDFVASLGAMGTRTLFLVMLLPDSRARSLSASIILFIPGHLCVQVILGRLVGFLVALELPLEPSSFISGCGFWVPEGYSSLW